MCKETSHYKWELAGEQTTDTHTQGLHMFTFAEWKYNYENFKGKTWNKNEQETRIYKNSKAYLKSFK